MSAGPPDYSGDVERAHIDVGAIAPLARDLIEAHYSPGVLAEGHVWVLPDSAHPLGRNEHRLTIPGVGTVRIVLPDDDRGCEQ
jgi:hypothetical protein